MDGLLPKSLALLFLLSLLPVTGMSVFSEDVGTAHSVAGSVAYNNKKPVPATRRYCKNNVLNENGSLVWCDGKTETDYHHYLLLWADLNGYCNCMSTYTGVLKTLGLIDV